MATMAPVPPAVLTPPGSSSVMMAPYSYTWIFALQMIVCFLDAMGIGGNDVANSFAPSVSSRSLTLAQAMGIAAVMEFSGAVALGASVTATMRDGIVKTSLFATRPDLLMSGFFAALASCAVWVLGATHAGWPISSTQSIICALAGMGVSAFGFGAVNWGWTGKGIAQIAAAWVLSPVLAGLVAAGLFLLTRFFILKHPKSLVRGIFAIPIYFTVTAFIIIFYIVIRNGKGTLKISTSATGGAVTVTGNVGLAFGIIGACSFAVLLFCAGLVCPFFYRRLVKEEKLEWYEMFYIWCVPERPKDERLEPWLKSYFTPHLLTDEDKLALDLPGQISPKEALQIPVKEGLETQNGAHGPPPHAQLGLLEEAWAGFKKHLTAGLFTDVVSEQSIEKGFLGQGALGVRDNAVLYSNKTEYLFSMLQIATASLASFAHGSNEVANASGATAGVYQIWQTGGFTSSSQSPTWLLAYAGAGLSVGLLLYGYKVLRNIGNRLTYHSPARGFCMELGVALAIITASFLGLPVSSTHCIVGATIGVGLCGGGFKAINWRPVPFFVLSWFLTFGIAATLSGCFYALITRGPSFTLPPS